MTQIAPSILSCDFANMAKDIVTMEKAGADAAHIDVMDGVFVPNISFGFPIISAIRPYTEMPFDVHLMITEPERYIERFIKAGADWVTVHYEACKDLDKAIGLIAAANKRVGLSIKPATPVSAILPYLDRCDMILIMTVEPGFGGQSLIPETLEKVKELKAILRERGLSRIKIEVDGGINKETARAAVAAGADILVAGSSVFSAPDMKEAITSLRG